MATPGSTMTGENMEPIMEAHKLVTQLYDPVNQRNPTTVNEIQTRIQQLQKGEWGWEIADSLLREPSNQHRFMGALTFIVKINVTGAGIDQETAWAIVERLINHIVRLVDEGEQRMVVRKLASSLVAIFRNVNSTWEHALWQLAASLAHGAFVSQDDCQSVEFVGGLLPTLSTPKATALVFFSVALAEEALRLDTEPQESVAAVIRRVISNIGHAFSLVKFVLHQITSHGPNTDMGPAEVAIGKEVMGAWKTWLGVFGNHRHDGPEDTLALVIDCGQIIVEALRLPNFGDTAATVLTSALESRPWAFDSNSSFTLAQILSNSIVSENILSYCGEDSETDGMVFVDLLVAYVSEASFDLFSDPMKPHNSQILAILQNVFKIPGYPAIEESATIRVLEYWGDIAESLPERLKESDPRYQIVKTQMAQVVLNMFNKLLYPSSEDLADWSDEERSEFNAYRYEACDYLLSAYPVLGIELVNVFQESAINHLQNLDWRGFEVAMFCLAQLSEAVDENGHADQCLDSIFGSTAFHNLSSRGETSNGEIGIPSKARQTLVDAFGKYQSYFERHTLLLPNILNILFKSLIFESCAQPASRSILALSKSCSRDLICELPAFLDQFDRFRTMSTATVSTMPKVLQAIATIIRKLDSYEEMVPVLQRLLEFFVQEANKARGDAAAGGYDVARAHGHLVLSCIASIGKGMRLEGHESEVIILDGDQQENPYPPSVWNSGAGSSVQQIIIQAMSLLIVDFPVDSSMIEAACDILRAGYTEQTGLFVFPPSMTVDFIKSFPLGIAGTDVIMATASSFLASHASHAMQIRNEASQLISHVCQLFASMLNSPETYDPETANAGIDFLARLLPKYHSILFSLTEPLPGPVSQGTPTCILLIKFTIFALARPEPLVLRSGSAFWVALLHLQGGSPEDIDTLDQILKHLMPHLCETLITQITGHCARSDLAFLSDVLRQIAFKKMQLARPFLESALNGVESSEPLSPQDKSRFIESLVVARGAKQQSLQIVRSLWLKCRGMSFDYAQ